MNVIHKYTLEPQHLNVIEMPLDSMIVSVQAQHDKVCIWAMTDPENPPYLRKFRTYYTGRSIPGGITYIGTVQLHDGYTVIHVFEED